MLEAVVKHYEGMPHIKATHVLAALQGQASSVLHINPKRATYEDFIGALEDQF
jgi:hypothetical protein